MSKKIINVEAMTPYFPEKAHKDDAAYDLYTRCNVEVTPNKRAYIPLGFKIDLPAGMAMVIQPRSGQSGKGMSALAEYPKWLDWLAEGIPADVRIDADVIVGLIDSQFGGEVQAIVKFGRLRLKHRIMRLLGFKFYISENSRICQGRLVYCPDAILTLGKVYGTRRGLGSTD